MVRKCVKSGRYKKKADAKTIVKTAFAVASWWTLAYCSALLCDVFRNYDLFATSLLFFAVAVMYFIEGVDIFYKGIKK